ncbi:GNAT family N-acetyltransferase [Entomomonas sp. E2T0]|uniref:GNAT family N-acetyltransferase n=1 Tax=Entomomonas sp. E2T0 TaxID=2930213 RepID=UPI0022282F27|nr:GNAT family N-acetyltransferase [Entomomonas sp. E2T0]UYZ84193.1 GNAT family N-acetyltransferase [Entomomonas sp. E2T0]
MLIELTSKRLKLRQWQDKDYEPFFSQLSADPKVMEYFPSTLDKVASDAMANKCRSLIEEQGWGIWAVELKATGEFIGFVGLHKPSAKLPFSPCVEVAWRLASKYWGNGYAPEAAQAALKFGFEELALDEIVSFTTLQNQRSQTVMKKLGFEFSEEFDHPALPADSPLLRHCLYRLSKAKWQSLV